MQQAQLVAKSGPDGTPRFVVETVQGSVLGALLQGLVEQHFDSADCEWLTDGVSPGAQAAVVRNTKNGRELWVFAVPKLLGALPPNCSAIHLASGREDVARGMRSLDSGPVFVAPELLGQASAPLTRRERQVAVLVAQGLGNAEIARQLDVSLHTVRSHLRTISSRLGVSSRSRLAAKVRELEL